MDKKFFNNLAFTPKENPMEEMKFHTKLTHLVSFLIAAYCCKNSSAKINLYNQHILRASELMNEMLLDINLREDGAQALLLYDLRKNTGKNDPSYISNEIISLVKEMTFSSPQEEVEQIIEKSDLVKLLKLYTHAIFLKSNPDLDVTRWNNICEIVHYLTNFAEINFGNLNIVKIAKIFAVNR